jgi:hypothetical protein
MRNNIVQQWGNRTIVLSGGSPRHKVFRCSTAPIGPTPMPLCRFTRYQNYRPTNRRRGVIGGRGNIEVEILVVNRTPSHGTRVRKYEAELSEVLAPLGGARDLIGVKHIASDVIDIDAPTTAGGLKLTSFTRDPTHLKPPSV